MKQKNNPGVYLPPPLVYVAFFFLSIWIQKNFPLDTSWQNTILANTIGCIMIMVISFARKLAFFSSFYLREYSLALVQY